MRRKKRKAPRREFCGIQRHISSFQLGASLHCHKPDGHKGMCRDGDFYWYSR